MLLFLPLGCLIQAWTRLEEALVLYRGLGLFSLAPLIILGVQLLHNPEPLKMHLTADKAGNEGSDGCGM